MKKHILKGGFSLVKADSKEWALYHAIYRLANTNIWFPTSLDRGRSLFEPWEGQYWIYQGEERVGGVIFEPNFIGLLFLIPPYSDRWNFLQYFIPFVISNSDQEKPIKVLADSGDFHFYHRLGFQVDYLERCMIRPTASYTVEWDEELSLKTPEQKHLEELADLYYEVYSKSNVSVIAKQSRDFYVSILKGEQFPALQADSSNLIYDRQSGELVAACMITRWEELPYLADIVVKSNQQGKGLGSKLIKQALTSCYRNGDPALRLWFKPGNPAEKLYHNLGFIAGVETAAMLLDLCS